MKIVRVHQPEDLNNALQVVSESNNLYVVFFGSEDLSTGLSWCPDCVLCDPIIRKKISSIPDSILIECPVGSRVEWKQVANHPYKTNPDLRVTNIPTLFKWGKKGPVGKLVENECLSEENLNQLIRKE